MELRFWGVRGSYPVPGIDTVIVGGNTTCVSVEYGSSLFVFDAGTGICRLAEHMARSDRETWHGCIFLSHYHWDHIQGLPFFTPAFQGDNRFHVYGAASEGEDPETILGKQMQAPYFPVPMSIQKSLVGFKKIEAGDILDIKAEVTVSTLALRHPGGAVGYRMDTPSGSVCIITDHEHPAGHVDDAVVDFARDASVLIHEAPYTPDEKRGPKAGWGHSSWHDAAIVAKRAGVKRLYLSHHEPGRCDEELYEFEARAQRVFPGTRIATEATQLDLRDPPFDAAAALRAWEDGFERIDARYAARHPDVVASQTQVA